ncbi:methyltransferase domain-containing protein [Haloterrigena salinisoli]|uniref:methyltransferase domain-containing protein n=1 Tax=Haloterrigena salinisoli TaxID=3132747 RepID=UPI0030D1200E
MEQKLNLGCGDDYRDGWVNADVRSEVSPDVVIDLDSLPLPFQDDTFDRILLDNVLEHTVDQLAVLRELHRVSELNAEITFRGPHWNSHGAWIDPTHTRPFSHKTFEHYLVADLFDVVQVSAKRIRFGRLLPPNIALKVADHIGQVVSEIEVTVRVRK